MKTIAVTAAFVVLLAAGAAAIRPAGPGAAAIQPSYPDPLLRKYDYEAVAREIEALLQSNPSYDDGSYGPILVRLAWHAAGSYSKEDGTGGSDGATMRYSPEKDFGANKGLGIARDLLEPVKAKFPFISYSDLWSLAGVVAIESMGGPRIPWRWGRVDAQDASQCPPDGRLPDAGKPIHEEPSHLRAIFGRMGFGDREIVALSGAHGLGRCHPDRSGWVGPWTHHPTEFTNKYFHELLANKWHRKEWDGPEQYEDESGQLMMLPSDMAILWDPAFRKVAEEYAGDEGAFFRDFAKAFARLQELGVPFPPHSQFVKY